MPKRKIPKPRSRKCLDIDERCLIEDRIKHGQSFVDIARELKRPISTISREIKKYSGAKKTLRNDCAHKHDCRRKHVCGNDECNRICVKFQGCICKKFCKDYKQTMCPKLARPPYVCNGCNKQPYCGYEKLLYDAKDAHKRAVEQRHESCAGFDLTLEQLLAIDAMVSPMLKNGNSVYHIVKALGDRLPVSTSTLYRLIGKDELTARNIDLRDRVKRKPRTKRRMKNEQAVSIRKFGRLWKDYLAYIDEHPDTSVVQMDCVEGAKTSTNVLLTLHWVELKFQIAVLMDGQTAENVVAALDDIEKSLGTEEFMRLFPLILTDNGTEFTAIEDMERSCLKDGVQRTRIFFCEPNMANEKGSCENNHRLIRYIIPKGTDLDQFVQEDISLCMSHVNSYMRSSILGKSAISLAKGVFPAKFLSDRGLVEIDPEKTVLKPDLLGLLPDKTGRYIKKHTP